jgi:hypothetical protein
LPWEAFHPSLEKPKPLGRADKGDDALSVLGLVMLKVCCSSLERSIGFYEALGFKTAGPAKVGADWVGPLYGIAGGTPRAQAMSRPDDPKAVDLELIE